MDKTNDNLTYQQALEAAAKARPIFIAQPVSTLKPPYPDMPLSAATQVKLMTLNMLMASIGRMPGDIFVDQTIRYQKLDAKWIDYLVRGLGIPANRSFAPFAADYILIFQGGKRLFEPSRRELFYAQLIHCLKIESQLVLTQQYYYGLKLNGDRLHASAFRSVLSDQRFLEWRMAELNEFSPLELHGSIFLEYYATMIRAQWDKVIRLCDTFFNQKANWESVDDGILHLEKVISNLPEYGRYLLTTFIGIARERLKDESKGGWLRGFRDHLLHFTAQHSAGVLPHKNSLETTNEIWKRADDEHNWLREAMMYMLAGFANSHNDTN